MSIAALAASVRRNGGDLSPPRTTDVESPFRGTRTQALAGQRPYWQWGFTLEEVELYQREHDADRYNRMLKRERRGILQCLTESMLPAGDAHKLKSKVVSTMRSMYNEELEQTRAVYTERAAKVGMSLVSYCKAFRVRGVLHKHEQGGVVL